VGADPPHYRGRPPLGSTRFLAVESRGMSDMAPQFHRGNGDSMLARKPMQTWEAPAVAARDRQRNAREGQVRPCGVTERPVVATKPLIPAERRGLSSRTTQQVARDPEIGDEPTNSL
jgi:hypothetical protein